MTDVWLRTNRRALVLGMILPVVLIAIGLVLVSGIAIGGAEWARYLGWVLIVGGVLLLGTIAVQLRFPRLAYRDRQLLVYLRGGDPIRVPVEVVECFFMGRGKLSGSETDAIPVRNLVMRIAEKATDYQQREVKPALGGWDEGYVTIHGAWCEPLTLEVVQRLNARLAEAQREVRAP
jgi:hypothetical protein